MLSIHSIQSKRMDVQLDSCRLSPRCISAVTVPTTEDLSRLVTALVPRGSTVDCFPSLEAYIIPTLISYLILSDRL